MRVAISQRVVCDEHGAKRDALEHAYTTYYSQFGITLISVPNILESVGDFLTELKVDGIILSGGNDVDPELYGEIRGSNSSFAPERDKTEQNMVRYAVENKLPLLAQCRGAQFVNVFFGGKLKKVDDHIGKNHQIKIDSTQLTQKKSEVNSFHSFGISRGDLGSKLSPFAETLDGLIEGFYHTELPIAAILWHPERASPDPELNRILIEAFIRKNLFWR